MGDIMKYHYAPPRAEVFENKGGLFIPICCKNAKYGQIITHNPDLMTCRKCMKKFDKMKEEK